MLKLPLFCRISSRSSWISANGVLQKLAQRCYRENCMGPCSAWTISYCFGILTYLDSFPYFLWDHYFNLEKTIKNAFVYIKFSLPKQVIFVKSGHEGEWRSTICCLFSNHVFSFYLPPAIIFETYNLLVLIKEHSCLWVPIFYIFCLIDLFSYITFFLSAF